MYFIYLLVLYTEEIVYYDFSEDDDFVDTFFHLHWFDALVFIYGFILVLLVNSRVVAYVNTYPTMYWYILIFISLSSILFFAHLYRDLQYEYTRLSEANFSVSGYLKTRYNEIRSDAQYLVNSVLGDKTESKESDSNKKNNTH